VINLTLFGTTTGLEVLHLPLGTTKLPIKLEDAWIEISPSLVTLKAEKEVLILNRRLVGEHVATWIGLYKPAREIGYDRTGGFYGAGAWIIDHVIDVTVLYELLTNLVGQISATAMTGDRFTKRINDIQSNLTQPSQISLLADSLSNINGGCHPAGDVAFVTSTSNSLEVLDWAQRAQSAMVFSKVVIGTLSEVPDAGSSTRVFRSLSIAIEVAFQTKDAELQKFKKELQIKTNQFEIGIDSERSQKTTIEQALVRAQYENTTLKSQLLGWSEHAKSESNRADKLFQELQFFKSRANQFIQPNQTRSPNLRSDAAQTNSRDSLDVPSNVEPDSFLFSKGFLLTLLGLLVIVIILGLTLGQREGCTFYGINCKEKSVQNKNSKQFPDIQNYEFESNNVPAGQEIKSGPSSNNSQPSTITVSPNRQDNPNKKSNATN